MTTKLKGKALYLKNANEKARMAEVMINAHKTDADIAAEEEQAHLDAEAFVELDEAEFLECSKPALSVATVLSSADANDLVSETFGFTADEDGFVRDQKGDFKCRIETMRDFITLVKAETIKDLVLSISSKNENNATI